MCCIWNKFFLQEIRAIFQKKKKKKTEKIDEVCHVRSRCVDSQFVG